MDHHLVEKSTDHIIPSSETEKRSKKNCLSRTELIEATASLLEEMIQTSSKDTTTDNHISKRTAFHAQNIPSISIKDYLMRFATYSNCHDDTFVYAIIYLDKIGEIVFDFALDKLNVHRFILCSLVSTIKFYDDYYYTNEYYAKIGGISLGEFNKLELQYLINYIQFKLYVDVEMYTEYYKDLIGYYYQTTENKNFSE